PRARALVGESGADQRLAQRLLGQIDADAGQVRPQLGQRPVRQRDALVVGAGDRKSTRLNSSHGSISYAVFCLKKKKKKKNRSREKFKTKKKYKVVKYLHNKKKNKKTSNRKT